MCTCFIQGIQVKKCMQRAGDNVFESLSLQCSWYELDIYFQCTFFSILFMVKSHICHLVTTPYPLSSASERYRIPSPDNHIHF